MDRYKQTVLITGGTSGIGLALVKKYLNENYFVIINYNNGGKKIPLVKEALNRLGYEKNQQYIFFRADVGNEKLLRKEFQKIPKVISKNITTLINNAGILKRGNFLELTQTDWIGVFNVNVFGVMNCSKLLTRSCPRLSNIITIGSIRGNPAVSRVDNIAYSISKSTIPTITAVLAKNLGPKIRVNSILPGTIDTPQRQGIAKRDMTLYGESNSILKRLGRPEEVAELCYFITSEKGAYITGSDFVIDGGYIINYVK